MKKPFAAVLTFALTAFAVDVSGQTLTTQTVERGANYRVVQTSTGGRYTELGSGISYVDENGQWQDSQEVIELTAQGAAAQHGAHKVFFQPQPQHSGSD